MSQKTEESKGDGEMFQIFVYGTLKRGQPNYPFLMDTSTGQATLVGRGHTQEKYPLVIAGNYNIPYLLHRPGEGHQVSGDIYVVDAQKQDFLDDFESHPTYYERMQDDIVMTDEKGETKVLKCWVYFMKNYKPQMAELTHWPSYDSFGPHKMPYVERYRRSELSGQQDIQQAFPN